MNITAQWRSHQWKVPGGEKIKGDGQQRRRFECLVCGRAFVSDEAGNSKWAVNQYRKVYYGPSTDEHDAALEKAVSDCWLNEYCPKKPLSTDNEDRKKIANGVP